MNKKKVNKSNCKNKSINCGQSFWLLVDYLLNYYSVNNFFFSLIIDHYTDHNMIERERDLFDKYVHVHNLCIDRLVYENG